MTPDEFVENMVARAQLRPDARADLMADLRAAAAGRGTERIAGEPTLFPPEVYARAVQHVAALESPLDTEGD